MRQIHILAIGAHPDDIEGKVAGTLMKYKKQGHKIFLALTTSGNQGSNTVSSKEEIAAIREKEQLEAAKYYSAEVRFLRYDDELLVDTPEVRRTVLNALRWANPDVIFTHDQSDPSPDHWMTGRLVTQVILSLPGKLIPADEPPVTKKPSLFFWDNSAGIGFEPEVYVDISKFIDQKIEAISLHESQVDWMSEFVKDSFSETWRTISRFRGIQAGFEYAECFRAHRIRGYMPDFRLLP